jgi:hypothetical protein
VSDEERVPEHPKVYMARERLKIIILLMADMSSEWDESIVKNYPKELPSFDELALSMSNIEFGQ